MEFPIRVLCLLGLPHWKNQELRQSFFGAVHEALPRGSEVEVYSDFKLFNDVLVRMILDESPPGAFICDGFAFRNGDSEFIREQEFRAMMCDGFGFQFGEPETLLSGIKSLKGYRIYMVGVTLDLDPYKSVAQ